MSPRNFYFQKIILAVGTFFTGITFIAVSAEQVSNLQIISREIGLIGLCTTILTFLLLSWYVRKYGIWWKNKEGKSFKVKRLKPYAYLIFLGLFTAFAIPTFQFNNETVQKPIFVPSDPSFKVLILPFNDFYNGGNCQKEVGKCLFRDLQEEKANRDLCINAHYYDGHRISMNFDRDSARQMANNHNADLVIYGDYKQVEGDDFIKYAYYLTDDWEVDNEKSIPESVFIKTDMDGFSFGTLETGDIAFIINWVIGLSKLNQYDFNEASNVFGYLLDSIQFDIPDTTRLDLYSFYISACAKVGNYREGFENVEKALDVVHSSKTTTYPGHYSSILQLKSLLSAFINDNDNALLYAEKAYDAYRKYNVNDEEILLRILNSLQTANGYLLTKTGINKAIDYGKQIIFLLKSKESKTNSDIINYGLAYGNIGAEFNDLNLPDSAIAYINKSLDILMEIAPTDSTLLARNFANLGVSYNFKGNDKSSLDYYRKAYDIEHRIIPNNLQHAITCRNMGSTYLRLTPKDSFLVDSAIFFLNKAKYIQQSITPLPPDIVKTFGETAIAFFYKKDFAKAKENILESIHIAENHFPNELPILAQQYYAGALLFFRMNDSEKASSFFQKGKLLFEQIPTDGTDYQMVTTIHQYLSQKLQIHL